MRLKSLAIAICGLAAMLSITPAQGREDTVREAPPAARAAAPALSKPDLDVWLDGFMPYALASGDIAGAVVVVVKDGQVLTERGYGYADVKTRRPIDPARTVMRLGSISKVFTWTAVMQQVEAGRLDLDKDVNAYLDFRIAPRDGKPVTLRNLMTHTPGFEDRVKRMFVLDPKRLQSLGDYLKAATPDRIHPPGEVPAYSNYGAALAGYIVERVSGEPFDDYVERHIYAPLGMAHSSFRQPVPARLRPDLSSGYARASEPARTDELVNARPAGAMTSTGADMAAFMLAHLNEGQYGSGRILQPATARLMHAPQRQYAPPAHGMALGFYREDRNGRQIIGHGGDTSWFHSEVHLLLDDHVGVFLSMNSAGRDGAAGTIRQAFLPSFMDRYFPQERPVQPTAATAREHARMTVGEYRYSRREDSSFFRLPNLLGQTTVTADPDGVLQVSAYRDPSGAPKRWREVGPFVWKDDIGGDTMAAVVRDGKVVSFGADDEAPVMVLQRVPGWAKASWNVPLLLATVAILLFATLAWPVGVLVRRAYGRAFELTGRQAMLHRLARVGAVVQLAALGVYASLLPAMAADVALIDDKLNPWLRLAQLLCLLGVVGAGAAVCNAGNAWTGPSRWERRLGATALALASLAFVWFALSLRLLRFSLDF